MNNNDVFNVIERMKSVLNTDKDSALAKELDIKSNAISTWKARGKVPLVQLEKFCELHNINPTWLKNGIGNLHLETGEKEYTALMVSEPSSKYKIKIDQLEISAIAGLCGFNNSDFPDVVRSIWFSPQGLMEIVGIRDTVGGYLITVPTDSLSPTINKGDIAFVDTKINSYNGEGIYVFDIDGETYIKRLQRIPGGIMRALSDNPLYPPFDITEKVFNTAVIRAKFLSVLPINPKSL